MIVTLAVGIPATLALVVGVTLGMGRQEDSRESQDISRMATLSTETDFLNDAVSAGVEAIRAAAIQADTHVANPQSATTLDPSGALLHVAHITQSAEGAQPDVVRTRRRQGWDQASLTPGLAGKMMETQYLAQVEQALKDDAPAKDEIRALTFRFDPHGSREWLGLVFSTRETPEGAHEYVAALVDPMEAFSSFNGFGPRSEGGARRAYLVTTQGGILAHSRATYVGADFSGTALYQKALASLFEGSRESGSGSYVGIDQVPTLASYRRVTGLPLALVLEETLPLARAQSALLAGGWERTAGQGLAGFGIVWFIAALMGALTSRRERRVYQEIRASAQKQARAQAENVIQDRIDEQVQARLQAQPAAPVTVVDSTQAPPPAVEAIALPELDEMAQAMRDGAISMPRASTDRLIQKNPVLERAFEEVRKFEVQARLTPDPATRPALLTEAA
ncbi:MAG TPA: hypothetical protein VL588_09050, partial [Bdellovibrionota bacterium]|nr:hypothetical protein [Bdellovibrionota bacterium]